MARKKKWIKKRSAFDKVLMGIPFLLVLLLIYFGQTTNPVVITLFFVVFLLFSLIYSYNNKENLSDNVEANRVLSPFIFLLFLIIFHLKFSLPFFSDNLSYYGALGKSIIAVIVYLYASSYYQPDLDLRGKRPGYSHFPVGTWIGKWRLGRFIKWVFHPVRIIWNKIWRIYSLFVTHRGITHIPIIGLLLRNLYLLMYIAPINYILSLLNIKIFALLVFQKWLISFFPFTDLFGTQFFYIYCLPIFLSDIVHILVDYIDSVRRGKTFVPSRAPRSILREIFSLNRKY